MDDQPRLDDRQLDEELAEFTDRILEAGKPEEVGLAEHNPVLRELEKIVLNLQRAWKAVQPDEALDENLRSRIKAEWRGQKSTQAKPGLTLRGKTGWRSAWSLQRLVALRLTAALVVLLIVALFFLPSLGTLLPAAAEGQIGVLLVVLLVLGLAGLLVLWLKGRKS